MISIITVCHNSRGLMDEYVRSFLSHNKNHSGRNKIEFIFVENSGDPSTEKFTKELQAHGFNAQTIHMENRGFGAGCNTGAKLARGELLVFANPDIRFLCDLALIPSYFDEHCWGTIRQTNSRGGTYSLDLLPEYRSILTEIFHAYKFLHLLPKLYRFCYPVGSLMIVPRMAFEIENGFDERFFLYYEEAQLSRRLRARLGPVTYCHQLSVRHEAFGTQNDRDFTFRQEARGMVTYSIITDQLYLAEKRLQMLRLLSLLSPTAAKRIPFLRDAIAAVQCRVP
jgi:GT2 family glycosyltransferase